MNINEIIKLSNEYEGLQQSGKEVEQLLKDRSNFETYSISHKNFEIKIHHLFEMDLIHFLEEHLIKIEHRMDEIEALLGAE